MDRKPWLLLSLICCLALLMVACSLIRSGKANKDGKSAAGQAEPAKVSETSSGSAGEAGKEGRERKWENYASDANGVDYYVDRETIAYLSKTIVHAWRKRTFLVKSPQKEIISFDEIDCGEARYRTLEVEGVYWDGRTKTFKAVSPWVRIFADSPDEVLYLDVCKAARDSK